MSTRAGKFVSADDLITEVNKRAFDDVSQRRPELDEETRRGIACSVALAGIRYDIVKVSPEKSTVFDWKEALNFERQSGPYIQYSHARACSILEKAGQFTECYDLETEQEIKLAKTIARSRPLSRRSLLNSARTSLPRTPTNLPTRSTRSTTTNRSLRVREVARGRAAYAGKSSKNTLKDSLETLGIDAFSTM